MLESEDRAPKTRGYVRAPGHSTVEMGQHFHGFFHTLAEIGERAQLNLGDSTQIDEVCSFSAD